MAVESTVMVATSESVVEAQGVVRHDRLLANGEQECRAVENFSAKCIELVTESGYRLRCAPYTRLMSSSADWVRADAAKEVVLSGYPSYLRASGSIQPWFILAKRPWMAISISDALMPVAMRSLVRSAATGGKDLVLITRSAGSAVAVQMGLLAMGLGSRVVGDRVVLEQPDAHEYSRRIGIDQESVRAHVELGKGMGEELIPKIIQDRIYSLIHSQEYEKLQFQEARLSRLQELGSFAQSGEMNVHDALEALDLVRALPYKDFLTHGSLVNLINLHTTRRIVQRVKSIRPHNRTRLTKVVGADHVANGFVVRGG